MSELDPVLVNRAVPPGSMRYFALLYATPEQRDGMQALYVIHEEIRDSALSANHDVAHTRLQWWRQEIERLVNRNPQHPATRVLASSGETRRFDKLHELIVAADMDLARMTYLNQRELKAYCVRSGGALHELLALQLLGTQAMDEATRAAASRIGVGIRQVEAIRDLRQDAYDGRIYLPLDLLDDKQVPHEELRQAHISANLKSVLRELHSAAAADLDEALEALPIGQREPLRPLLILARLYLQLLLRIARQDYNVGTERIELGPVEKPWVAWRTARRLR